MKARAFIDKLSLKEEIKIPGYGENVPGETFGEEVEFDLAVTPDDINAVVVYRLMRAGATWEDVNSLSIDFDNSDGPIYRITIDGRKDLMDLVRYAFMQEIDAEEMQDE